MAAPLPSISQKLAKSERLCSKVVTDYCFRSGRSLFVYPFKISWLAHSDVATLQATRRQPLVFPANRQGLPAVLFSVPKRTFKRANVRNLLRRRSREAYRHAKHLLLPAAAGPSPVRVLVLVYAAREELTQGYIEKKLTSALKQVKALAQAVSATEPLPPAQSQEENLLPPAEGKV